MTTQQDDHRVRVVIDCSTEERACIKMLAAKKHMTISEYFLSFTQREMSRKSKIPNKTTLDAHQEALNDGGTSYESMDDFWADMEVNRHAKP